MNFKDNELELLDLTNVNDFIKLFQYFCGQEFSDINMQDKIFLQNICRKTDLDLDYKQLNTILLVLNQPNVSKSFFQFFFNEFSVSLDNLKENKFPNSLLDKITYDPNEKLLIFKGVMSIAEKDELLSSTSDDEYKNAINSLFDKSQNGRIEDLSQLKRGVAKFRGYAMLCYGNFRFAFKELSRAEPEKLRLITQDFTHERGLETRISMGKRPAKLVEIETIPEDDTYYLGYLCSGKLTKDTVFLAAIYSIQNEVPPKEACNEIVASLGKAREEETISNIEKIKKGIQERTETLQEVRDLDVGCFSSKIHNIEKRLEATRRTGQENTDRYLTWDYMDVYVATSMREEWEYKDCANFTGKVFGDERLKTLNLRYFDPTQSYVPNRIDKGLIEGLMLKRATCTIYLAQETDTLGKDSELAATLAQGKPVIAFVPKITKENEQAYCKKYEGYGIRFLAKRLMLLQAEEILEEPILQMNLEEKFGSKFEKELNDLLENKVSEYLDLKLFNSWESRQQKEYKEKNKNCFDKLLSIFVEIEKFNFEKRALTLIKKHPLALQVSVNTGIANGVLVVRNESDCAKLLYKIFANSLDCEIIHEREEAVTILKEGISQSPFRVVTDYERLTNSFWNFYLTGLEKKI